ncbi:hypothetical protein PG996_013076 [Apiospora saccharicola]|uniref:Uncharacterized protein n=1 Tax=Apiospora saccharicola TaxID=335842 RepID=A0ABR1U4H0_9PEZI
MGSQDPRQSAKTMEADSVTLLQPAQKVAESPRNRASRWWILGSATSGLAEKAPLCGKHLHNLVPSSAFASGIGVGATVASPALPCSTYLLPASAMATTTNTTKHNVPFIRTSPALSRHGQGCQPVSLYVNQARILLNILVSFLHTASVESDDVHRLNKQSRGVPAARLSLARNCCRVQSQSDGGAAAIEEAWSIS